MCMLKICKTNKLVVALSLIVAPFISQSQSVIGNWNFNNTLAATGGANNTASNASLSSAIPTGAYNGGNVYYGEGGWPTATTIDTNTYLEFTLTPNAGYTLNLSSIDFNIRRSTTGSPQGAGPRMWALRSSLDGFASDITARTLTTSPTTTSVSLGGAYVNLPGAITFRVYGYDVFNNPGGLNRFVFENISARGLSSLPIDISKLSSSLQDETVKLSFNIQQQETVQSIDVQRSVDGNNFSSVSSIEKNASGLFNWQEFAGAINTAKLYYRIKVTELSGEISYSNVAVVQTKKQQQLNINSIYAAGNNITTQISAAENATAKLTICTMDGKVISQRAITLVKGTQTLNINVPQQTGVAVLSIVQNNQVISKLFNK